VMSLVREKRLGFADISCMELERNLAVSRVQSVKHHLSFHRTTFRDLITTSFTSSPLGFYVNKTIQL